MSVIREADRPGAFVVPEPIRRADQARRRRIFAWINAAMLSSALVGLVLVLAAGAGATAWVSFGAATGALALNQVAVARGASLRLTSTVLVAVLFAGLSALVLTTGGVGSSAPFALAMVPMLAVLFAGWRYGIFWTLALLAEVAVLWRLHANDYVFPAQVEAMTSTSGYIRGLLWVLVVLCLLSLMFGWRSRALLADLVEGWHALHRAREDAQRASGSKDRFLSNMSHEIRTPMNGVMGSLELLRGESLDPEQRRAAEVAHRSAQGLLRVLGDIVDIARVEAGALAIEVRPFAPARVLRETVDLFMIAAAEKGLALTLDVDPTMPGRYLGDDHRVRQIFVNLVGNAIKFTLIGRVSVQIEGGENGIIARVRDTGVGVAEADRERIFEPFVQADASTTRRFGGTGLGLAISRQLAARMGGTLTLDSAPGKGSTFTLSLPLTRLAPGETRRPTPITGLDVRLRGRRVLVVEDNAVNRLVVSEMLTRLGCAVEVAEDGLEAVRRASERFDLVLMDCQMPRLDGYDATRALRARGMRAPIVALTANAMEGDRERCLAAGMDDYLDKPVSQKRLVEVLGHWVG